MNKILFVSTEADPFAKSGGLGDVIGSLPKELNAEGADARVILPLFRSIKEKYLANMTLVGEYTVSLSWRKQPCAVYGSQHDGVIYYFIDNDQYFDRDNYYAYTDDGERFAFFSRAVLEILPELKWKPDVLHCNEWQSALITVYLKTDLADDPFYRPIRTVFTIHNAEYQGHFASDYTGDVFGVADENYPILEFNGRINLMKAGIVCCDRLTTVSPTYAQEIQDPGFSHGLGALIGQYAGKLTGIINGIDLQKHDPAKDPTIVRNYTFRSSGRKAVNKKALQEQLGLAQDPCVPMIGMIGRLVSHKGMDLVQEVFDRIMAENVQIVILGTGDGRYEDFFVRKAGEYGGRVSANICFSSELANRIYASSDLFLMPSKSEPCGIAQMFALRYGAVPIVRETGGLKDTVPPFDPECGTGNGITFTRYDGEELLDAVKRGLALYGDAKKWETLVKNAFKADFSWARSAKEYMKIYESIGV